MDATPLTVGQEMSGWVSQLDRDVERLKMVLAGTVRIGDWRDGGGNGIERASGIRGARAAKKISELTGQPFQLAPE